MIMKTTFKFLLAAILIMASSDALATTAPPPAYASLLADIWYFIKTQGMEWGFGFAAIALGLSKALNLDNDWARKGGNFAIGTGVAFAMPNLITTMFGSSGFALSVVVGG